MVKKIFNKFKIMCQDTFSVKQVSQKKRYINIKMGCVSSESGHDDVLSQDLERQLRVVKLDKRENQVERFDSNKPQKGFKYVFESAEEDEEQFGAVRPWIGALVAPTNKPQFNPETPNKKLILAFVNGFKIEDSRQNMFWGKNKDQIIYCVAALGINMNTKTLAQKYMGAGLSSQAQGHIDDVMSLGVCPKRKMVVTGSLGALPEIIVWDSQTMAITAKTNLGRNTRAVSTIRFSRNGQYFFCSDKHNDSNVYCFKADTAQLLGQNKCGSDPVLDGECGDDNTFAVATKRGLYIFEFNGSSLEGKRGVFNGNTISPQIVVTFAADSKTFFSGTSNGEIYEWSGNSCIKSAKVHQGSVRGLQWSEGYLLSSGSKDNILKISKGFEVVKTFDIDGYAVSLDYFNGNYLVATSNGKVLSIQDSAGKKTDIMQAHSTGQTWGLGIGPNGSVYTTADDNKVLEFNPKSKKVVNIGIVNQTAGKKFRIGGASSLSTLPPNQQSRAVAVSKTGHVALGVNDGTLSIRSAKNLNEIIFEARHAAEWIEVLKYSPQGDKLAVGSHDNNIYIYQVDGSTYTGIATCKAHQSFITNLDWSADGKYIHSNCGAYEYLFFDSSNGEQIKNGGTQLRDEQWSTYTIKIGWWVQGIFPPETSGDHVNGVDRNHGKDVIATGDDWGFVNLYRNPGLKGAKFSAYRAHSSHVVRVLFDDKDEYLYSVGGYDKALMMWKYS